MRRIPLNSAAVATATHRASGKVANGTSTQMKVQIIDKWRVKMTPKRIYKVEDSSWRKGEEKKRGHCSNLNCLIIPL